MKSYISLLFLALFFTTAEFAESQTIPSTSFAQEALTEFLGLLNPLMPPTKCLLIDRTIREIFVDPATLASLSQLAMLMYLNVQGMATLLRGGFISVDDESARFKSPEPVAKYLDHELKSTDIVDIVNILLDELSRVAADTTAVYKTSGRLPGCVGANERIKKDSVSAIGGCKKEDYNYYQLDGACLNPGNPGAGLANRAMTRIGDPFCTMDGQSSVCELPSARAVSLAIGEALARNPAPETARVPNVLVLNWAQFVAHDTSQASNMGNVRGENMTAACARNDRELRKILSSPHVESIEVDCDDPFYMEFEVRCLNFVRAKVLNEKCIIQKANFLNTATPIMDLNPIYQRLNPVTRKVESMEGPDGKLLKNSDGEFIIPLGNNRQHTLIAMVDLLISTMHDLIVDELKRLKPSCKTSTLFRLAKKINIVMYQHVWYNDILATFVGTNNSVVGSIDDTFESDVVPQIMQEYGAAAGRFSHVFTEDEVTIASCTTYETLETIPLRETFGDVELARQRFRRLVCGAARQAWRTGGVSPDLQNFLFMDRGKQYGGDLFAIDAQRARDACLEPYVKYLERIFGICVSSWDDLVPLMPAQRLDALRKIYKRVEDVELYAGGLAESSFSGATMGRTFNYMTVKQFEVLKAGDPKFFTHSLAEEELEVIRSLTLTKYMCIAAKLKRSLQDMRFRFIVDRNDVQDCECKTLRDCFDLSVFFDY